MTVSPEEFDPRYTEAAATVAARAGRPRPAALAAVLFVPPGPSAGAWRDICAAYAHDHRYYVVAVATSLAAVVTVLASGRASVAVFGQIEQLPTDEPIRIEFVNERSQDVPAGLRRPVRRR